MEMNFLVTNVSFFFLTQHLIALSAVGIVVCVLLLWEMAERGSHE